VRKGIGRGGKRNIMDSLAHGWIRSADEEAQKIRASPEALNIRVFVSPCKVLSLCLSLSL
jgi:hypothetical protein